MVKGATPGGTSYCSRTTETRAPWKGAAAAGAAATEKAATACSARPSKTARRFSRGTRRASTAREALSGGRCGERSSSSPP